MRKLILVALALSLMSACAPLPPCEDSQCVANRQAAIGMMLQNQQHYSDMQQQNLMNLQNNLARIQAPRQTHCTYGGGFMTCY